MRIWILGKNSDDKGTQLENLTRSILSELGYTNIISNEIRSGGEEIDVSADIQLSSMTGIQTASIICECKAYKQTVDISAWLKFLGKIFTAEKSQKQSIWGCFIALNGVNGNVAGHYNNLSSYTNTIMLVSGEDLFNRVSEIYKLCDLENANKVIQSFTNRQVLSFEEIAYYEKHVFRIVVFEGSMYTILRSDGQPIDREKYQNALKEAAEFVLPADRTFIDLREEAEAIKKAIRTKKMVISQLFLDNGKTTYPIPHTDEFTESDIHDSIRSCIEKGWLTQSEDSKQLHLISEEYESFYSVLADIYRFLLAGEMAETVIKALASDYHAAHINERMVSEIQKIQGGLPLTDDEIKQVILLLKWSPTALDWSLYPNEMLVNYHIQKDLVDINTRESGYLLCKNYFLGVLYTLFKNNFRRRDLHAHFYQTYGLREIETLEKLMVKSSTGVELQGELPLRQAIIQMDQKYINSDEDKFVMMIPFASARQPWDSSNSSDSSNLES